MSLIKAKLALLTTRQSLSTQFAQHEPILLSLNDITNNNYNVDILICDICDLNNEKTDKFSNEDLQNYSEKIGERLFEKQKHHEFSKIIFLLKENSKLNLNSLSLLHCDFYLYENEITSDFLFHQWQLITQKEQDEAYLNLSSELNHQYELLRTELENKLFEKSKHLIESRKQIFEINNRVEILRKSLFATTEVKNLTEAETVLNDLLVGYNLITWLKIVNTENAQQFENYLKSQFESNCYSCSIKINQEDFNIYFFKGDRRAFKKQDLNYFNKLSEALQINLNRYNNLLSLQKNERLYDLAFHSSPHPIIIIDSTYHIFQANLAAEKKSNSSNDNLKCYELLFERNKPCLGCQLGSKFKIQHDVKTYAVQSNTFNNSLDSDRNYWIHFYEDISEQKALESKFQQTARLSELGLISSSIAHELNNPLGGILSFLQIMKMELPVDHPFITDINFLTDAANRMKKHIEDLLLFSRKEDVIKLEKIDLIDVFQKNLDLLQMQLKKEHLTVTYPTSYQNSNQKAVLHNVSILHFRNTLHLVFQFLLHKLKLKKQNKSNFNGIAEIKISQDEINSYLSILCNLGPHDLKLNSNDLSLITLEKSILDQGFQLVISEPQPMWLQLLVKMPL